MTYEEAIKVIKNNYPKTAKMVNGRYKGGIDDTESKLGQALNMAIEALEKQIPKKPSFGADGTPRCSECLWDEFYNKDAMRYCPSCGQAINWEGTE